MNQRTLSVNGVDLHLRDVGTSQAGQPTLVFLHYWGGSSRTWTEVIAALETTGGHPRALALDQRGWGESAASGSSFTIADLADDAQAVIAKLGLESYVLIGHSMGGKAAQLLASRRPAGLKGMVLVAPSPPGGVRLPAEQREAMLGAYLSQPAVEATLDHVLTATPLTGEIRRRAIEDSLRGAAAAKTAWPTASIAEDVSAQIGRIAVPTLVLGGEHDQVDPIEVLRSEVVARIPGAVLEVVSGTGHLSPLEVPVDLAARISRFVSSVSSVSLSPP